MEKAQFYCYRISAIKRLRRLLNLKAARRSTYCKAALKRGSRLFQGQIKYSHEILKLTNFLFSVNNQELLLRCKTLYNSKTTNYFQFFIGYMLAPYIFWFSYEQISIDSCNLKRGTYYREALIRRRRVSMVRYLLKGSIYLRSSAY